MRNDINYTYAYVRVDYNTRMLLNLYQFDTAFSIPDQLYCNEKFRGYRYSMFVLKNAESE